MHRAILHDGPSDGASGRRCYAPRVSRWAPAVFAALVACAPPPLALELPSMPSARALVIAVERGDALLQLAAFDAADAERRGPDALREVEDDETLAFTVIGLPEELDPLGLDRGVYAPVSDPAAVAVAELAARGELLRTTVSAGLRTEWLRVPSPSKALEAAHLPSRRPCRRFAVTALPRLGDSAAFAAPLGDGTLVGTIDRTLRFVPASGEPIDVTPAPIDGVPFPTLGGWPVEDAPLELWLGGPNGVLWHAAFDAQGGLTRVIERHDTGLARGAQFAAGEASRRGVELYMLGFDGVLALFDGTRTRELHRFDATPRDFVTGGLARDVDGAVIAVRNTDDYVVVVRDGVARTARIGQPGVGLYGLGLVPGVGLLVSDAAGRAYVRRDGVFVEHGDTGIAAGVLSFVPVGGGFLAAGAEGALREWRSEGGYCPIYPPLVTQSIRVWSPRKDGAFLVTGPHPHVPGSPGVPLSLFREAP